MAFFSPVVMFEWLRRRPLTLALSSNQQYARGLCVTVRSVLEHLPASKSVRIVVLDGGIQEPVRRLLMKSWSFRTRDIEFRAPDLHRTAHLKRTQGMQPAVYFRLQLPELLEDDRVLYLDSDMLALADISPLWDTNLENMPLAAVPDCLLSTTLSHIPHWQEIGLNPNAPYFSSALMLMDLEAWRKEHLSERVIRHIAEHPETIRWWDQDGLNCVVDRWKPLDLRWNVYAEASQLLGYEPDTNEKRDLVKDLIREQWIVHFATRYKPWWHACPHPKATQWYEVLDRTAFAGWRPDPSTQMPYPPQPLV
jgi:lipopolysaccharide biosynthesis glycosyltransferase